MVTSDGARRTRTVLTIDLKNDPAIIHSYRTHHQQVWPEVVASLQRAGITRMDIYILDRRLVMILETDGRDFQQCMALHVASHPRVAEWEALMHSMQEPPPGGRHENWWSVMEPLFQLDPARLDAAPIEGAQEAGAGRQAEGGLRGVGPETRVRRRSRIGLGGGPAGSRGP